MTIQHELIADPKIHEPKGVAAASANTVYVANGGGSGAWSTLTTGSLPMTAIETDINDKIADGTIDLKGRFFIFAQIDDVSTADEIVIPIIRSCTVIGARFTLGGAITTADSIVQVKAASGSAMGSNVTIAFTASAKGTSFSFTANANNVLTGPTWMSVTTDGGSTVAQKLGILIELEYVAN
jgi:hypothetical protein